MFLERSLASDAKLFRDLCPRPPLRPGGPDLRPLQLVHELAQSGDSAQSSPGIPVACAGGQGNGLTVHTVNLGWQEAFCQPKLAAVGFPSALKCDE